MHCIEIDTCCHCAAAHVLLLYVNEAYIVLYSYRLSECTVTSKHIMKDFIHFFLLNFQLMLSSFRRRSGISRLET